MTQLTKSPISTHFDLCRTIDRASSQAEFIVSHNSDVNALTKPFETRELIDAVGRAIGAGHG